MAIKLKLGFFLVLLFLILGLESRAAENADFDYPELSVVPRATEQVLAESIRNRDSAISKHWTLLAPATMTFLAGSMELIGGTKVDGDGASGAETNSLRYFPWIGIGVGAAWWAIVLGLVEPQDEHASAVEEIKSLPSKTTREQLFRERRAEEAISKAASLTRKLKWISIGTNLLAGVIVSGTAKQETAGVYFGAGAVATAFIPLLFSHRWDDLDQRHQDYKKRIYAPVAGVTFLKDQRLSSLIYPGLSLSFAF